MKTLAYCFTCHKEHDISKNDIKDHAIMCECGGYVISPSGKANFKLIPENDEDKKILGFEIEKDNIETDNQPLRKVFRMDEYSWVCAVNKEEAIKWYINTIGVDEEELDIRECDIDKEIMYSEISLSDLVKRIEQMNNYDEKHFSITKKHSAYFIEESFRDVIESMIEQSGYESVVGEPFEICSTEW